MYLGKEKKRFSTFKCLWREAEKYLDNYIQGLWLQPYELRGKGWKHIWCVFLKSLLKFFFKQGD